MIFSFLTGLLEIKLPADDDFGGEKQTALDPEKITDLSKPYELTKSERKNSLIYFTILYFSFALVDYC